MSNIASLIDKLAQERDLPDQELLELITTTDSAAN